MFYLYDINTYHRNYGSLQTTDEDDDGNVNDEGGGRLWYPSSRQLESNHLNDNHSNPHEYKDDHSNHNPEDNIRHNHPHRKTLRRRPDQQLQHETNERLLNIDEAIQSLGMGIFQYRIGIAAGMLLAADSIELVLLSFLSNIFRQSYHRDDGSINPSQPSPLPIPIPEDSISSDFVMNFIVVIAGVVGAIVWGILGDSIGRRPIFVGTSLLTCIFSMGTSICTSYSILLIIRFIVGFGIGGLTVPFCTLSEFLPPSQRGTHLMVVQVFCILGPLFIHFMLATKDPNVLQQDWRTIVVWCSFPSFIATLLGLTVVPESPRWLLSQNRSNDALVILKVAAKANGKDPNLLFPDGIMLYSHEPQPPQLLPSPPTPTLRSIDPNEVDDKYTLPPTNLHKQQSVPSCNSGCLRLQLLSSRWIRLTAILWGTYFGMSFLTHGTISLAVSVFSNDHRQQDYQGIFTATSQFLALFLLIFVIDGRLGRSSTQCVVYSLGGLLCLTISLFEDYNMDGHPNLLLVLTFFAHTCMFGGKCTTWISTTEILSTNVRTTGHGMANSISRIGGFLSTYVISRISSLPSVGLALFIISLWTASTASKIPETNAKEMGIVWNPPVSGTTRRRQTTTTNTNTTAAPTSSGRHGSSAPPTFIYV